VHSYQNLGGGTSGYLGAGSLNATAVVMMYVEHEPYPTTQTPSNFVTLAELLGTAWTVVGDGTAP
jgi:hypothetical protein